MYSYDDVIGCVTLVELSDTEYESIKNGDYNPYDFELINCRRNGVKQDGITPKYEYFTTAVDKPLDDTDVTVPMKVVTEVNSDTVNSHKALFVVTLKEGNAILSAHCLNKKLTLDQFISGVKTRNDTESKVKLKR